MGTACIHVNAKRCTISVCAYDYFTGDYVIQQRLRSRVLECLDYLVWRLRRSADLRLHRPRSVELQP